MKRILSFAATLSFLAIFLASVVLLGAHAITERLISAEVVDNDCEVKILESEEDISDDVDYATLIEFYTRQEEYKTALLQAANDRISEYWNAEVIDMDVYLDDAYIFGEAKSEHISVINVAMHWNVEKNEEQTRRMLSSYSDDMAVTLHNVYPDIPIDQMCIVWEVPNILESGYAAKYQYYSIGKDMFCADRYGLLYGRM